jgi:hypothetical protein
MKKQVLRLTENDLHKIIKESVKRILKESLLEEGEKWIGSFDQQSFDNLRQLANQTGGNCSFSLNGTDFTLRQANRGFSLTSGGISQGSYDALSIESALRAAWKMSNNNGNF